ncbi:unnamed protein product [Anisakis simplex]|uniref:Pre-mRNA-processing factor 39 (inferred by orthology to a human protein) n=1 Tax=Anisakis simplex TaxID=6269 RepID=A0A0M3K922_ANISI|nr:unnamed protein product [Anisakis simplex]
MLCDLTSAPSNHIKILGNYDEAIAILVEFDRRHPGYAIVPLRRIGIERRMAISMTANGATVDYSSVISRFERLIQDAQTPRRLATFYAIKLARFHAKTRNDRKLAEKILRDALNRDKDSPQLYLALIDLAYEAPDFDEKTILEAFDNALDSEHLSSEQKLKFSQRKLDFLEDLGTDIKILQQHLEYHSQLQKSIESTPSSSKRTSDHLARSDHADKRVYTGNPGYPVPYIPPQQPPQQPQYYVPDVYSASPIQQPPMNVINPTAYYYPAQPTAVVSQIQQTY